MLAVSITIDTEADHDAAWGKPSPLTFRSVVDGVPNLLTPLFARHGARPTYLVTDEVMNDPASVETLRAVRDGELGTHLHGEHGDFICYYPPDDERRRLDAITRQFADRFGRRPRTFRAGRYAASSRTVQLLSELGYVADTSVTPRICWTHEQRPHEVLDFRNAPIEPYRPSTDELARPGNLPIWEIPVTILDRPLLWDAGVESFQRLMRRRVQRYPLWLRPSTASWPWLRWAVGQMLDRAKRNPLTVINIMMHSMEFVVGASPHSATKLAARRVTARLDRLCRELRAHGARFRTLTELASELDHCTPGAGPTR